MIVYCKLKKIIRNKEKCQKTCLNLSHQNYRNLNNSKKWGIDDEHSCIASPTSFVDHSYLLYDRQTGCKLNLIL